MRSTLVADMPKERAVGIARSAGELPPEDRNRLARFLMDWLPFDEWVLRRVLADLPERDTGTHEWVLRCLIAELPQHVATAMLDLRLAEAPQVPE